MLKGQKSFRSLIIATLLIFATTLSITASSWSTALSLLGLFTSETSVQTVKLQLTMPLVTPNTCDTAGPIEVEGSILGTTPTAYATLNAAFNAISGGTHTGAIAVDVCGDTVEAAIPGSASVALGASGSGGASYASVLMRPVGGVARTIIGTSTAGFPLLDFNGADNVTLNGLNTGGNSLTIANTTVSATSGTSTIRFQTDATSNLLTNLSVLGSATMPVGTSGGNVWFGSAAVTTGNDNNTVSFCNIGPAGSNLPTKGIFFSGTSNTDPGTSNSGIVINGNNIFDYFSSGTTSAGVYIGSGSVGTVISNNKFYQTSTRTFVTGVLHSPITISNTNGNAYQITGNTIGFANSLGTGTYTLSGGTNSFRGINLSVGTTTATSVQGNTIAGISQTTTTSGTGSSSVSMMIYVSGGLTTVGDVIGNTIGSQSATGSITYTSSSTSASDVIGMYNTGSSAWTTNNNTFGGITVANSSTGASNIYGLRVNTGSSVTWTCQNNIIGGNIANSLQSTTTATGTTLQGIRNDNPIGTISGNTIRNLTAAGGTGTTTAASLIGVAITSAANQTIGQNTIHSLTNGNTTAASIVTGIQFTGSTANVVERNFIYNLLAPTTSTAAEINGIRVAGGTTQYRNNMIALGANQAIAIGTTATNSSTAGINGFNGALGTDTFFHNSVYIGGTATSGSGASYAFNGTQTTNTRSFRNNIFQNSRSNSGATGKHYALKINGTAANPTGLTINNNVYLVNGASGAVFGFFNSLDVANIAAWRTAVGQDVNSFEVNAQFIDPTNSTPNLRISQASPAINVGSTLATVTDDYDGQPRPQYLAYDIGADEVIDTTAPVTTILTSPTNPSTSASATFTFSSNDTGGSGFASFQCQIDGGGYSTCTSGINYPALADGLHTFNVRAIDGAGNTGTAANFVWLIDANAPETTILTSPNNPSISSSATFTFSGNDGGGSDVNFFQCQIDAGGYTTCVSGINYPALSDGPHTFNVRAVDNVGNTDATPATFTWSIDTVAPVITPYTPLGSVAPSTSQGFTVAASDNVALASVAVFYSVNGTAAVSAACSQSINYDCTIPGLALGDVVTYFVRATDTAGNTTDSPTPLSNLYTVGAATIPAGTYAAMSVADGSTLGGDVTVTGDLALGGILSGSGFTTSLGCSSNVLGAGATAYVNGAVKKDFCSTGAFTYPVGQGFYSKVDVTITALATNPSSLTVTPDDQTLTGFIPTQSLSRNWGLVETGNLTATLLFYYDDSDVNGAEANYRVWRREDNGTVTDMCGAACVNTGANTIGPVAGVSTFSRWTGAVPFGTTAAEASISGRVTTSNGRGISNAVMVVSGNNLEQPITVRTGSFGYYNVENLGVGETYIITINSKRFSFTPPSRVVTVNDNVVDFDFVAEP